MKYIGNIVTKTKFTINSRFKLVESYDDIIQGLPTLIIGYDAIKVIHPEFNILHHKINEDLFWTFRKNEKRDKFNEVVLTFVDYCFNKLVSGVNFLYIDPIHYSESKLAKISKKLNSCTNAFGVMVNDRVIYIYSDNIIYSFDIDVCEFTGIKREVLISKFSKLTNGFLDFEEIFIEYGNDIAALNDSIRYLPFLYSIDNE